MQSVIVYRNPLEAAMWDFLMGGNLFIGIAGVVVFFVVFLLSEKLIAQRLPWNKQGTITNVLLGVSAIAAFATMWVM